MFEICSKLTIKTPERSHWRHSGVFIVNFKNIAHFVLVFLLLTLNMQLPVGNDPYTNKQTDPHYLAQKQLDYFSSDLF